MTTTTLAFSRPVLADRLPTGLVRDISLVAGVAALTAAMAQIALPMPGSPVPVTGQTFAILLCAAAVGPLRGLLGQLLYIAIGLVGFPVFAQHKHGYEVLTGSTGGYFLGFLLATIAVGYMARAGLDRKWWGMALAFAVGSALIYLPGATWLAHFMHWPAGKAFHFGVELYLIGDLLKAALAGALLPTVWRFVRS